MIALSIYCENLYSFEQLNLDLTKYHDGVTIILGKNLDMDSANGAGKSAIIKIIYFAIYGKDLKNTSVEKIIRRNSQNGCLVVFKFQDGKDIYTIQRYRNYKNKSDLKNGLGKPISGTGVDFFINGLPFNIEKDPSKTESIIQAKIQTSNDMFKNSVLTEQKRQKNFLENDDSKKKETLIEMLNLDFYEFAQKLVKDDIESLERSWTSAETNIVLYKQQIEKKQAELIEIEAKSKNYIADSSSKLITLKQDLKLLEEELPLLEEEFNKIKNNKKELKDLEIELQNSLKLVQQKEEDIKTEPVLIRKKSQVESLIIRSQETIALNENKKIDNEKTIASNQESINKLGEIKSFTKEIAAMQSDVTTITNNIKSIELSLKEKDIVNKNKASVENSLMNNENKDKQLKKELEILLHEAKCNECNRTFKEGESEQLDVLINKKNKESSDIALLNTELNKKLQQLNAKLGALQLKEEELKEHKALLDLANKELTDLRILQEKQENILKEKMFLENQINKLNLESSGFAIQLVNFNKTISEAQEEIKMLNELFLEVEQCKKDYTELVTTHNEIKNQITMIKTVNSEIDSRLQIIGLKKEQEKNYKFQIKDLEENSNPYNSMIQSNQLAITSYNKELVTITKKLETMQEEKALLNFWKSGFSKTGIISFITEDIIKFLNARIKEYLEILSDGNLSLIFSPESKLQKGTISNKIETKMWINGEETIDTLNSGGELQRFVLTVDLALSDMVEDRSPNHFNLKFLDEPFDGIDTSGQIKALALFKKIAENRKGFFIISHDKEMQSFCDNTIYVLKKNDISRIVDKETFLSAAEVE